MLSVASLYIENDRFHVSFLRLRVSNRDLIKNVFTLILTFGTHVFPGFLKVLRRRDFIPPRPDPSRTSLSLRLACVPQHLLVTRDHVPRPSLLPSSCFCTTCQRPLLPVSNLFIHPPLSSEWFSAYFYNHEKHHSSTNFRITLVAVLITVFGMTSLIFFWSVHNVARGNAAGRRENRLGHCCTWHMMIINGCLLSVLMPSAFYIFTDYMLNWRWVNEWFNEDKSQT